MLDLIPGRHKQHVVIAITLGKPGGATFFAFQFACWLKEQGIQVTMLAGEGDWLFTRCTEVGIPCHRIPSLGREIQPWRDLKSLIELIGVLRKLKPTALHLNSSKMGVLGSLAGRWMSIPRIAYCIGGWSFLESLSSWKRDFYIFAERLSSSWKDVIVCVHPGDLKEAVDHHIRGREETRVIPNGINLEKLDRERFSRHDARLALSLPMEGYLYGTIGNFYPAKDLPRYLEACALVHAKYPQTQFVLIGDGPERAKIEATRQTYQLEQVVHLLGSREEAARYLAAFDCFVFPSAKEGMAFALLEAMTASLPCVVTDVGANRWVLGDAGWIVPPRTPAALAKAMETAAQDPILAQQKGAQARATVETRFPLQHTFTEHLRLLFPNRS